MIGALLLISTASFAAEDRLVLLDGGDVAATIQAIDASGKIQSTPAGNLLDLGQLRSIERPIAKNAVPKAAVQVYLAGGGVIQAARATIQDEVCRLDWSFAMELSLPIDAVRAVRLNSSNEKGPVQQDFNKALAAGGAQHDQLFMTVDGRVQAIEGVFEQLTAEHVVFTWQGKTQSIPRDKASGLAIAPLSKSPDHAGQCLVTLSEGSSLWVRVLKMDAGQLSVALAERKLALPWESVTRLDVNNSRLTFLSDLTPVEVVQEPLVTLPQPAQRDKSVSGRPLTLGFRTYEKGLGVHSRSLLTFENERFNIFAATVGIDAETLGKGDCLFVVLGDGRQLVKERVRGGDPPSQVRANISGLRRITLAVEPGEDLDLADHGDWCDARFIVDAAGKPAK